MPNKKYLCPWCGNVFEQVVNKVYGEMDLISKKYGKKGTVSDQVKCSKCGNFIKTWD